MVQIDIISNIMSAISNAEAVRKKEVIIHPASKFALEILKIMKREGYIKDFQLIEDGRGNKIRIELSGKINKCRAIKPRFPVKKTEILEYAKHFLPSRDIGILIISTPKGVKTHQECLNEGLGGVLVAYVY
ncbi:30S ribosomal protein S8 [Candidatus Geothermarchaeota archaeon]|nr:MAG: 30S ribosomal protein S8 [Candidatus Geothermarchaeota archaeon]RLG62959.1 MAG: 30S ribosomal protein S8 [Candidatus Geothermarchaeota archaeon]HEW93681.1 30S ribosomal protein S8 [Thermoprotei archaeon]